jgi:Mor family transcriptional regulator
MSANAERVPALMLELADVAQRVIQARCKVSPDEARDAGLEIVREVCTEFGGELLYIPKGTALAIDERDRAMFRRYVEVGRDIQVVVREFDICVQQAYRRVKLVERAEYHRRQPGLFPEPGK